MAVSSNYSILVDVELQTANIQKQLNSLGKNAKLNLNTAATASGLNSLNSNLNSVNQSAQDASLTFQAANMIWSKSVEIITSMIDEVFSLDTALTEFKKATRLSGSALDDYVDTLAQMGEAVARTGKPKCLSRSDGMVNQH